MVHNVRAHRQLRRLQAQPKTTTLCAPMVGRPDVRLTFVSTQLLINVAISTPNVMILVDVLPHTRCICHLFSRPHYRSNNGVSRLSLLLHCVAFALRCQLCSLLDIVETNSNLY